MLRVALVGVSHWHARFYYEPLMEMEQVSLCAVGDPNPAVAQALAERLGCPWFTDYERLYEKARPDFVFALAPHDEMPAVARSLIAAGIGFSLEKPCGVTLRQVAELSRQAAERGLFVSVPFAFRCAEFIQRIRETVGTDRFAHMSFRFIAGTPQRYIDAGCDWMLDPLRSGGGCTMNLAVHFVDLFRVLTGVTPRVVGAAMSNSSYDLPIEDYSAIVLAAGDTYGVVETGYTLPAPTAVFDLRFSLRSKRHYFTATGADTSRPDQLVAYASEDDVEAVVTPVSQVPYYAEFVRQTLDRFRNGRQPVADLSDMCEVMQVIEAAYATAGWPGLPGHREAQWAET
jgi:predicted dehydrogenase